MIVFTPSDQGDQVRMSKPGTGHPLGLASDAEIKTQIVSGHN